MTNSITLPPLGNSRPPTNRQLLNRDLLAESCDQIIVDALTVHDVDQFRADRVELLELIRAARVVRDRIRRPAIGPVDDCQQFVDTEPTPQPHEQLFAAMEG